MSYYMEVKETRPTRHFIFLSVFSFSPCIDVLILENLTCYSVKYSYRCFILLYIHNPATIIITKIIKPTKIGASTSTRNTAIAIITNKTIIPTTMIATVPRTITND